MNNLARPNVVVIGGGTGSFAVLSGLKKLPAHITALVNMADDGGSTGQLRDQLGVLPPGDVRQCLVALSDSSDELRALFTYRFPQESDMSGHSFGNLFLSAVEKMTDNFNDAVRLAGEVLQIRGAVLPVTLDKSRMILRTQEGITVKGQYAAKIYDVPSLRGSTISFSRKTRLNPLAKKAIAQADLILIAPGDLYTSIAPALSVDGMQQALLNTSAKVVYICNLVDKPRQTVGYMAHDYAHEVERFMGGRQLDYVAYNTDQPSAWRLKTYALQGEFPVEIDENALQRAGYACIPGKFLSRAKLERNANDTFIYRSLIRHDGDKLARAIWRLYKELHS